MALLTTSGNEITDAVRTAAIQGDGATPPAGFGVWEAATNICTNGGFETNLTGWVDFQTLGAVLTRDTTASKFGGASLKIVTGGVNNRGAGFNVTTVATTTYTYSMWILSASGVTVFMQLTDLGTQGLQSGNFVIPAGVWTRIFFTATTNGSTNRVLTVQTASSATFNVDGVQLEQAPFATPYVETNGATASRGLARVQAASSYIGATQGWIAVRAHVDALFSSMSLNPVLASWANDSTHWLQLYYSRASTAWRANRTLGGASNIASVTATPAVGDFATVIMAWTGTAIKISVNGASFVSTAGTTIPALTAANFDIGSGPTTGDGPFDGDVRWFMCGTGTLTNADATTLNALGNTAPTTSTLGTTANTTLVLPFTTAIGTAGVLESVSNASSCARPTKKVSHIVARTTSQSSAHITKGTSWVRTATSTGLAQIRKNIAHTTAAATEAVASRSMLAKSIRWVFVVLPVGTNATLTKNVSRTQKVSSHPVAVISRLINYPGNRFKGFGGEWGAGDPSSGWLGGLLRGQWRSGPPGR